MKNTRITLAQRPQGMIKTTDFELVKEEVSDPKVGEVLVRQVFMSLDPAMRAWMDDDRDSYIPPVEIGETMRSLGVGVIEQSKHDGFPVGTRVSGFFGWTEYSLSDGSDLTVLPDGVPLEHFIGVLGLPGLTAYHGLMEALGAPEAGNTVLISGAAGAVGSLVGQIAKAEGMRVIGVTGSDEKRRWLLDELGFDAVVNYKTENIAEKVREYAPNGIDFHFENVGGEILKVALDNINENGKIVLCGLISTYNNVGETTGPDLIRVIKKRVTIKGFVIIDQMHRFNEIFEKLGGYLEKGQLKYRLDIVEGLEQAPAAINKLFDGSNQGKLVIRL
ncbi:MAG: NADP-dependent oxidoreductase [Pseudomonadota bacterium]